jgi:hypothetical protein
MPNASPDVLQTLCWRLWCGTPLAEATWPSHPGQKVNREVLAAPSATVVAFELLTWRRVRAALTRACRHNAVGKHGDNKAERR